MPLNTRKLAHLAQQNAKLFDARAQPITLVCRNRDGSTGSITIQAIWRILGDYDPVMEAPTQSTTRLGTSDDVLAEILTSAVTLQQLRSCLYAYPGPSAPPEPATKYIPTNIEIAGMIPGGSRYFVSFAQQH